MKSTPLTPEQRELLDHVTAKHKLNHVEPTPYAEPTAASSVGEALSARELEVLWLISNGMTNAAIARTLYLSEETVKSHVRKTLSKLQANSRAHAVAVGLRSGLIV
jgi:DNA-binding NarL/FixJ family response regulator